MTDQVRANLKRAILKTLDEVADEHRSGHQDVKANRYKLRPAYDVPVELMFEKGADQPANLWVLAEYVAPLLDGSIAFTHSPKAKLHSTPAKGGGTQYGRHSALQEMVQLAKADLVCFNLSSREELDRILAVLMQLKRKTHS